MRRNTFEIFPVDQGRFAWRLVAGDREVARSARTYRSRKRVRKAIGAARRADLVELGFSARNGPVVLRPREFELVGDVNQLLVGDVPRLRRRRDPRDEELQAEAEQEMAAATELRAEAQAETAFADELETDAETLEADAQALEADAKAKAAKAKPARRGRATRG